jgi:RHH-type proline utilization regulon transcriptional repressor/proline dehydrogenase/delta 1-pyrroline-5-carboxylate dehydrogenase
MDRGQLEEKILERGRELFGVIGDEAPSVFNKDWWTGRLMDWSMRHEDFKLQLFRFIDVLPCLTSDQMLADHVREYFAEAENVPAVLKLGAKSAGVGGRLGMKLLGGTVRKNLESMARQFIVGHAVPETIKNISRLRNKGFAFTLDVLGEATVSEQEADAYAKNYIRLLQGLESPLADWPAVGEGDSKLDWGYAPKIDLSIKPSALYSQINPADLEGSVGHILDRLRPVYRKIVELNGSMCIDIEMRKHKEITFELYRRLRSDTEFRDYPHLCLAMQAYLKSCDNDAERMLGWAREQELPISIRLVKGAYWDYEVVAARQNGWPVPVHTRKCETDAAFERCAEKILRNQDICRLACGSHNVRSACAVLELARALEVPKDRYEFQILYGMAEPFRNALLKTTGKVRLYCPQGELLPGMAYLIRRLLENTSNESFLRQTYVEGRELEQLLKSPQQLVETVPDIESPGWQTAQEEFVNEPFADFSLPEVREAFGNAITETRKKLGKTYLLSIGGEDIDTGTLIESVNPARQREVIGRVCQAGTKEIEAAIAAAQNAFLRWRDTPPRERADYLIRAAQAARDRIYELSAWQVLEAGKQWKQAYNDVVEAIDFLQYYAREMIRLSKPRFMGNVPGEVNQYFYQPKGVAAVIAPWNFPLAISCGMSAAAIVAGNCVVYKPSNQTPVVGYTLLEILRQAGLPPGVFNYAPGSGSVMGDYLIDHPQIAMIAFTGSMEVGLRIIERAGRTPEGQASVKKVVAEMGGKNALIVDDDADLDEAVPNIIDSAFAYQGQKCSACSRVIVLDSVYERFIERLLAAAKSVRIGPAEDPANFMGPVIGESAQKSITEYIDIAGKEGSILYSSEVQEEGCYVPITIVEGITPDHRLAQEEVFGPVLAVMRAKDFDQAIEWANSTRFALTGGLFSRSPGHIEQCRREFRVGNLYINRGCTGAIVERQPFGGFKMSGVGSKAGGPDYLLQFMDPRTVTENTMRRGFVPISNKDERIE